MVRPHPDELVAAQFLVDLAQESFIGFRRHGQGVGSDCGGNLVADLSGARPKRNAGLGLG